ncbi:MAG: hypothetical protein PUE61_07155 [Clostridiales bacterium]|nr:hypothetical protein [Clostridiales bacterium]
MDSVDDLLGRENKATDSSDFSVISDKMKQVILETQELNDNELELVRMFLKQIRKNRE